MGAQPASGAGATLTGGGPDQTGEEELNCFKRLQRHDVQLVSVSRD